LRFFEYPVDFIVVSGAGVDHDMFVAIEEHEGHFIIEFVHCVKIWYPGDIHDIESNEIAEFISDLHHYFIDDHAGRVPVMPETDDY
jgi:hypothetical protein